MPLPDLLQSTLQIGITATLLVVFVWYFIKHGEKTANQYAKQTEELVKSFYERESFLRSEAVRAQEQLTRSANEREKILRDESIARESLMRSESARREEYLLRQMQDQGETLKTIAMTMTDISKAYNKLETKIDHIERMLHNDKR